MGRKIVDVFNNLKLLLISESSLSTLLLSVFAVWCLFFPYSCISLYCLQTKFCFSFIFDTLCFSLTLENVSDLFCFSLSTWSSLLRVSQKGSKICGGSCGFSSLFLTEDRGKNFWFTDLNVMTTKTKWL